MKVFGIILAIVVMVYLASKSINIIASSLVASVVVLIFNQLPVFSMLSETYQKAFANFISSVLLMLLFGAALSYLMEKSGCAASMAHALVRIFGRYAIFSIPIIVGLLTYGGIKGTVSVFMMLPIMVEVCRENDVSRSFMPVMVQFAAGNFANSAPGSPSVLNVTITNTLDVPPFAGGVPGFIASICVFVIGMIFFAVLLSKSRKRGEHFVAHAVDKSLMQAAQEKLPSPWIAVIILISVPLALNLRFRGENVFSTETALFIGCVLCILFNLKRIDLKTFFCKDIGGKFKDAIWMMSGLAAMSGFGACIAATEGYNTIVDMVVNLPGNPYVKIIMATSILAAATGSATAACTIIAPTLGSVFVGMGLDPGYVARLMAITGTGLDSMPNNGGIIGIMQVCDEKLKDCYYPFIWMTIVTPLIGAFIMAALCTIMG